MTQKQYDTAKIIQAQIQNLESEERRARSLYSRFELGEEITKQEMLSALSDYVMTVVAIKEIRKKEFTDL